jgi:hypothetical protein
MNEYALVCKQEPDRLVEEVNRLIKGGWRPQGGVTTIARNDKHGVLQVWFVQAMVR